MRFLYLSLALLFLTGCSSRAAKQDDNQIVSMQLIDRNGFSETISSKDRLSAFQKTDFSTPQPYKKILRVFGKSKEGKSTSIVTSYHENGHLAEYLEVKDGRAHGAFREWYQNGKLKIDGAVIEGVADISDVAKASWHFHGRIMVYNEEEHPLAEIFYDRGMLEALSTYYHADGSIWKKIPYHRNEIEGEFLEYDEKGSLSEKSFYLKGQKHGVSEGFWNETQLAFHEEYDNGNLLRAKYYYENGELICEVKNSSGTQAHFADKKLYSLVNIRQGLAEGAVKLFSPKGNLLTCFHIKDDKKSGEELQYYPINATKGKLQPKLSLFWQEDVLQGIVKTWYENGVLESQREMDKNQKHGLGFAWYPDGTLMLMEEYDHDNLLRGSYYQKGDKAPVSKVEHGKGTVTLYTPEGHFLKKINYEKGKPQL